MEKIIENAIKLPLEEEKIELVKICLGEEDGEKTLFITIDNENGVDTEMCVKATRIINEIIDKLEIELDDYILDVGSKGSEE